MAVRAICRIREPSSRAVVSASFPARSASPALLPGVELLSRRDVTMSKTKFFPGFHAEVQAHTRLERSTPDLERDHAAHLHQPRLRLWIIFRCAKLFPIASAGA